MRKLLSGLQLALLWSANLSDMHGGNAFRMRAIRRCVCERLRPTGIGWPAYYQSGTRAGAILNKQLLSICP